MKNFFPMTKKTYERIASAQCILVVILLFIIFHSVFGVFVVPSLSMYPTLHEKEFLLCHNDNDYNYEDIVVFHPAADNDIIFVKRVLGKAGDVLEVHGGELYRNGEVINSSYTADPFIQYEMEKVVVPADSYFMMGDNRNNSADSHVIGSINKDLCVGQVIFHGLPFWWKD